MANPVFYVACPLGERTGGPEALTLLVEQIRHRGFEAFLIPMWNFRGRSVHPDYSHYDFKVREGMEFSPNSHLILTEVSPIESFRELRHTPDDNIWMLWLSVNFSPLPSARYFSGEESGCSFFPPDDPRTHPQEDLWPHDSKAIATGSFRSEREAARRTHGRGVSWARRCAIEAVSIRYAQHVVRRKINFGTQSFYGQAYVRRYLGAEAFMLTDYPRRMTLPNRDRIPGLVVYNGAKGKWKMPELQALLPDVNFQPLEGMTYREVCEALASAQLYVEVGHLPGRDRLPREAALVGTPTIMLARGAGYCWRDFPIGERYRIPYTENWAYRMSDVIRETLADTRAIQTAQEEFREWVREEPRRYAAALDAWLQSVASR